MKEPLVDIIQSIHLLPPQVLEEALVHFQHLEYPKNYFLLKPLNLPKVVEITIKEIIKRSASAIA